MEVIWQLVKAWQRLEVELDHLKKRLKSGKIDDEIASLEAGLVRINRLIELLGGSSTYKEEFEQMKQAKRDSERRIKEKKEQKKRMEKQKKRVEEKIKEIEKEIDRLKAEIRQIYNDLMSTIPI